MYSVEQVAIQFAEEERLRKEAAEFATRPEHLSSHQEEAERKDDGLDDIAEQGSSQHQQIEMCRQEAEEKMDCKMVEDTEQGREWKLTLKADGTRELVDMVEGRAITLNEADAQYLRDNIIHKLENGGMDVSMDIENKTTSVSYGLEVRINALGEKEFYYRTLSFIDSESLPTPSQTEEIVPDGVFDEAPETVIYLTPEITNQAVVPPPPVPDKTLWLFNMREQELQATTPKVAVQVQEIKRPTETTKPAKAEVKVQVHGPRRMNENGKVVRAGESKLPMSAETADQAPEKTPAPESVAKEESFSAAPIDNAESAKVIESTPPTPDMHVPNTEKSEVAFLLTTEPSVIAQVQEQIPSVGSINIAPSPAGIASSEPFLPWGDQDLSKLIDADLAQHIEQSVRDIVIQPETGPILVTETPEIGKPVEGAVIIQPVESGRVETSLNIIQEPVIPITVFPTPDTSPAIKTPTNVSGEHALVTPQQPEDSAPSPADGNVEYRQPTNEIKNVIKPDGDNKENQDPVEEASVTEESEVQRVEREKISGIRTPEATEGLMLSQKPAVEHKAPEKASGKQTALPEVSVLPEKATERPPLIIPLVPFASSRQNTIFPDETDDAARSRQSASAARAFSQAA